MPQLVADNAKFFESVEIDARTPVMNSVEGAVAVDRSIERASTNLSTNWASQPRINSRPVHHHLSRG